MTSPPCVKPPVRMIDRPGYVPVIFNSSEAAWHAIQTRPDDYDLIVSDLSMPVMTGTDLARNVLNLRPQFPIVITSGYTGGVSEGFIRELGIRELVLKPLDFQSLAHAINRALRVPNQSSDSIVSMRQPRSPAETPMARLLHLSRPGPWGGFYSRTMMRPSASVLAERLQSARGSFATSPSPPRKPPRCCARTVMTCCCPTSICRATPVSKMVENIPALVEGLPIILLTGQPTVETAMRSVRLRVVAYLAKPPDFAELCRALTTAIVEYRNLRILDANRRPAAVGITRSRGCNRSCSSPPRRIVRPRCAVISASPCAISSWA